MKKVVSLGLALSLVLSCNGLVFGFTDVNTENPYLNSISYMADKGYIGGYSDGSFKPDKFINIYEYGAILVRASENKEFVYTNNATHWGQSYLDFIENKGWLLHYELQMCKVKEESSNVTREVALKGLFEMTGLSEYVYNSFFYTSDIFDLNDCLRMDNRDYLYTAYQLGLIEKDENGNLNPGGYVTRGEVCEWVYKLRNIDKESLEVLRPSVLDKINIQYLDGQSEAFKRKTENALGEIPNEVVEKFVEQNWKLKISNQQLASIYSHSGLDLSMAVGVCDYGIKTIYVTYDLFGGPSACLQHEMGHYVDHTMFNDSESRAAIKKLYKEEVDALAKFVGRDYCKTSEGEFFAEAFYAYVAWGTGTERMMTNLKNELPGIYEFFNSRFAVEEPVEEVLEVSELNDDKLTDE